MTLSLILLNSMRTSLIVLLILLAPFAMVFADSDTGDAPIVDTTANPTSFSQPFDLPEGSSCTDSGECATGLECKKLAFTGGNYCQKATGTTQPTTNNQSTSGGGSKSQVGEFKEGESCSPARYGQRGGCNTDLICTNSVCSKPVIQNTSNQNGESDESNQPKLLNPLRAGTVEELFMVLLDAVKTILQIFFVIALVWCGWLFIEAQGNEDKLKKARKAFMYTIIGGVIVVGISFILGILNATVSSLKVI